LYCSPASSTSFSLSWPLCSHSPSSNGCHVLWPGAEHYVSLGSILSSDGWHILWPATCTTQPAVGHRGQHSAMTSTITFCGLAGLLSNCSAQRVQGLKRIQLT
jgi:hypothetical protein